MTESDDATASGRTDDTHRDEAPRETVAFVTGRLAEPSLRRVLDELQPDLDFDARVVTLGIAVAALMTTDWIAKKLPPLEGIDRLVLPGFAQGDLSQLAARCGRPVERGPKDLRELPAHLGRSDPADDYGAFDIEIIAEINHVPRLSSDSVLALALDARRRGADLIDLGCDPDGPFLGLAPLVERLCAAGLCVSVDSLDPREIREAVAAGAELVLSVRQSNIELVRELDCEFVVLPDDPATLGGLDASVEALRDAGRRFRIDPVLEPIGFGFARSLERYLRVRDRYPDAEMLMGIGNLTELTDADSAAINVVLLGFCQELGIRSVLTTEVINWARTSVDECDLARRLVHWASERGRLPKHREPRLHPLRASKRLEHGEETLTEWARAIRDDNLRIFAERGELHVLSRRGRFRAEDPFELFDQLEITDASHAFYLGYEMAKAVTALTLAKNYVQDEALDWGYLTREETSHLARKRDGKGNAP